MLIPEFMRHHVALPGAERSPAVEDGDGQGGIGFRLARGFENRAELITHLGDAPDERGELVGERQVSAEAHAVERASEHRAARRVPVPIQLRDGGGLVSVKEGIREKVR